ncbi:amidohydrolase [Robiginitalea sp. IMCC44478]|uniref:amidohydrolase n=1 Tax=Robiginitalea sp. IMCC44478 TaxID=3459122 RepID=UPI004042C346
MANLDIALVQTELSWEQPELNLKRFEKIVSTLTAPLDLLVLPEMFTSGFTMEPGNIPDSAGPQTLEWMQNQASSLNAAVVGSVVYREQAGYFNRLIFMEPDGNYHTYDKRHTFTLAGEDKVYQKGKAKTVISFRGWKICPLICYDLRFPVWSRNTEGYDLLLYVANWPAPRIAAWDTLLKARAIENMSYVAGVNRIGTDGNGLEYTGHSAAYDCLGHPLAYSEKDEILRVSLSKNSLEETRNKLRFLEDRDSFSLKL